MQLNKVYKIIFYFKTFFVFCYIFVSLLTNIIIDIYAFYYMRAIIL